MIILLLDSGARRAELVGLRVEDLDLEHDVARVIGKGRRDRALPFGRKTAVPLDRYLRIRSRHAHAASPWLWLGQKGPLTATGLAQMLWRRGRQAGIEGLHAHPLRHTFAHAWLARGGLETDLMRIAGWRMQTVKQLGTGWPRPAAHSSPGPSRPPWGAGGGRAGAGERGRQRPSPLLVTYHPQPGIRRPR
jgi:integrase